MPRDAEPVKRIAPETGKDNGGISNQQRFSSELAR